MPLHPRLAPGWLPTGLGGTRLAALGADMGSLAGGRSGGLTSPPMETPRQVGRDRPARCLASLSPWLPAGHVGRPQPSPNAESTQTGLGWRQKAVREPDPVRAGALEVTREGQGLPGEGPARGTEGLCI